MSNYCDRFHWMEGDLRDAGPAELEFGPPECPNDRMIGESCDFFDIRGEDHRIRRLIQRREPENLEHDLDFEGTPKEKWDLVYWLEPRKNMIEVNGQKMVDRTEPIVWIEKSAPVFPKRRDKRVKILKMPGLVGNLARAIAGGMTRKRLFQVVDYHRKKKELSLGEVSMLWNLANRKRELDMIDIALEDVQTRAAIAIFQAFYAPCKATKALVAGFRSLDPELYQPKEEE